MSSLDEKIARAKTAQADHPVYKDETVSLDASLSDERLRLQRQVEALVDQREAAIAAVADVLSKAPDTQAIDKRLNAIAEQLNDVDERQKDSLITVRLYRAKGDEWLELKAASPARINSAVDRGVGYNVNSLTVAVLAAHGRILDADAEVEKTLDEWIALSELLSGGDFERLADLVLQVNVTDSLYRTEQLKNS